MENVREVVVVGEGSASGTPDRCIISLALNVAADTSADAIDRVAQLADQVVGVIHAQGVEPSDVQTHSVSLQDFYDQEKKRVTARVASYALSVNAPSLASVGRLLAELAAVCGDSLQVRGLQLAVSNPQPLLQAARRAAVEDAVARADQLAEAAGVRLGTILSVDEGSNPRPQIGLQKVRFSGGSAAAALPVEGGTASVTVQVTVRLAIED
jgi:uncharacterized protein YggE